MKQFESSMEPFCYISKIPVTFINTNGDLQWECCANLKICNFFNSYPEYQAICKKTTLSSTKMAAQLGEPYISLCPSGLVKITKPLITDGEIQGFFIAGPIAMGNNKESIIKNLLKNIPLTPDIYPMLTIYLSGMNIFTPKYVAYLASLFDDVILSSIITNIDYRKISDKFKEQAHLGERIQKYKRQNKSSDNPNRLEEELIYRVKNGDGKGAQDILIPFLNEILLLESGNLSFIKIQVIGLCAVLSRITSKQDRSFQTFSQEIENMDLLNKAENFKELCLLTTKIVDSFLNNNSLQLYSGSSLIVKQAIIYINENHMNKISLTTAASVLHTNQSYLSTLFKKEMGINFVDYLNGFRTKESQDLLSNSNLSLLEISQRTGFDSQSYFTKVFKRNNGMTPNEYRKANQTHSLI